MSIHVRRTFNSPGMNQVVFCLVTQSIVADGTVLDPFSRTLLSISNADFDSTNF
jgi:hypothetical protein